MKLKAIGSMVVLWLGFSVFAQASAGLNDAFGIDLWSSPSLWQDSAPATAKRLGIEGNKVTDNAHYKGELDEKKTVLGVRAYSLEIYATGDKISEVSIGFVNRADLYNELARKQMADKKGPNKSPVRVKSQKEQEIKKEDVDEPALYIELEKRMAAEEGPAFQAVVNKLTQRIGKPNDGDEPDIKKWIWSGHRLIAEKTASSVTLKITPVQAAEATANVAPAQQVQQVTAKIAGSVNRRGNGDTVIGNIPPISQGDRGFCVPATWEKVLRYYGLNVDVYQLADKGGTDVGGSMFIPFAAKMSAMLEKQNYAVEFLPPGPPDLMKVKAYIDKGIPLIWGLDAVDLRDWVARSDKRGSQLPQAKTVIEVPGQKKEVAGHCLMVIGYNAGFQELALSDSTELGSGRKEIWISMADAAKADLKQGLVAVVPKVTGAASGSVTAGSPASPGSAPAPATNAPPSGKKWY